VSWNAAIRTVPVVVLRGKAAEVHCAVLRFFHLDRHGRVGGVDCEQESGERSFLITWIDRTEGFGPEHNNRIKDTPLFSGLKSLSWINPAGNPIPEEAIRELKRALPKCKI